MGTGPTQPTEQYFDKGLWGYDGAQWRKLNLLFGYRDRYAENLGGIKAGAGVYTQFSTPVPAGEIWIIEALEAHNNTTNPTYIALYIHDGATTFVIAFTATPGASVPVLVTGEFVLKEGDRVGFHVGGCLNLDSIAGFAWGYKMAVT